MSANLQRVMDAKDIVEEAVRIEREACAKACEAVVELYRGTSRGKCAEAVGDKCAQHVRARSMNNSFYANASEIAKAVENLPKPAPMKNRIPRS